MTEKPIGKRVKTEREETFIREERGEIDPEEFLDDPGHRIRINVMSDDGGTAFLKSVTLPVTLDDLRAHTGPGRFLLDKRTADRQRHKKGYLTMLFAPDREFGVEEDEEEDEAPGGGGLVGVLLESMVKNNEALMQKMDDITQALTGTAQRSGLDVNQIVTMLFSFLGNQAKVITEGYQLGQSHSLAYTKDVQRMFTVGEGEEGPGAKPSLLEAVQNPELFASHPELVEEAQGMLEQLGGLFTGPPQAPDPAKDGGVAPGGEPGK